MYDFPGNGPESGPRTAPPLCRPQLNLIKEQERDWRTCPQKKRSPPQGGVKRPKHDYLRGPRALANGNEALRAEIAGRSQVEQALRESEEKFRAIVETTSEWIWAIDRRGLLTYSNPAVKAILGTTRENFWARIA